MAFRRTKEFFNRFRNWNSSIPQPFLNLPHQDREDGEWEYDPPVNSKWNRKYAPVMKQHGIVPIEDRVSKPRSVMDRMRQFGSNVREKAADVKQKAVGGLARIWNARKDRQRRPQISEGPLYDEDERYTI